MIIESLFLALLIPFAITNTKKKKLTILNSVVDHHMPKIGEGITDRRKTGEGREAQPAPASFKKETRK
jgi:hypothetical protein